MDMIIKISIELIVVILAYILARYMIPGVKNKLSDDNLNQIMSWVTIFVHAAENLITDKGSGNIKYEYVVQALAEKLNEYNVELTEQDIRAIIENAVYVMNKTKEDK